jgi:hypothetical protein
MKGLGDFVCPVTMVWNEIWLKLCSVLATNQEHHI